MSSEGILQTIPREVGAYLESVTTACPSIAEIWLFGSRANGTESDRSDWDLLAFGDGDTCNVLRGHEELRRDDVDLLVVDSSGNFQTPWGDRKKGSLESWRWSRLTDEEAAYEGRKWCPDVGQAGIGIELGSLDKPHLRAFRLWSR